MKKRTIIKGVIVTIDDGDLETSDIVDTTDCPELCAKGEKQHVHFLIRGLHAEGYRVIDKKGNIVNECDI